MTEPGWSCGRADGHHTLVYPKPHHVPASDTILNFPVPDVAAAVDELTARGVVFERYEGPGNGSRAVTRDAQ